MVSGSFLSESELRGASGSTVAGFDFDFGVRLDSLVVGADVDGAVLVRRQETQGICSGRGCLQWD